MGLCRRESKVDTRMMAMFPTMAMGYVRSRIMNRGRSSQGRSAKPSRINSSGWLLLIRSIICSLRPLYQSSGRKGRKILRNDKHNCIYWDYMHTIKHPFIEDWVQSLGWVGEDN